MAIVKVGGTEDSIRAAAQRFLNQQAGIDKFTREVLAGALRSIVGRLTIEEIIRDRAAFASAVAEEAEPSLTGQGLVLDTFQLQDIQAEGSYLPDLGRPEAARVLKEAAIAEASARQQAEQEQLLAEEAIASRQPQARAQAGRDHGRDRRRQGQVGRGRTAGPGRAGPGDPLRAGEGRRAERGAQGAPAGHRGAQARRRRAVPGRAGGRGGQNAAVSDADAQRQATIAAAQAGAEQARLTGEGERARRSALAEADAIEGAKEGEAEQLRRQAIADAVEREGQAEARRSWPAARPRRRRCAQGRGVRHVRRGGRARPAGQGAAGGRRRPRPPRCAPSTR